MKSIDDYVLTKDQLDREVRELCASPVETLRYFGSLLQASDVGETPRRKADPKKLTGRIIRSCLLDVFDIVRRASDTSDMQTHMCMITRNGIKSLDGEKLTPADARIYDGIDELAPQSDYVNDWLTYVGAAGLAEELRVVTSESEHRKCVRSFRCFREAYFSRRGSFVLQIPTVGSKEQSFEIARADHFRLESLELPANWEEQQSLDAAAIAFSKFIAAKFRAHKGEAANARFLFLIAVGSNALPRGFDLSATRSTESTLLSTVQSVWVVVSVPATMSGGSPIARMAACLPEIDSAMTQSLVFDLVSRQEQLAVELEADRSELKRLKGHITSADESFQAFEASARTVFGAVSSSTAMLRRLANDLDENILSSPDNGQEYDSLAGGKPLPKIHNVDTDPGLFTKEHTPDLVQRLDDAFKGREEALKLFREEIKDPCQQLIWLKKHVYKLHADSQVGMSEWITVGALRAALWWKCDPNCKQDDETRNLDEVGFLKLPSRQGKHSPLVDDARDFIRTLAAVVEAWLEPKAPAGTWVRLGYKMEGSCRILVLGGGGSRRVVDEARLNALALQLDRAVRDGRRDRGGDLTNSLMALTRTNVYAPPKVTFVAGAVWDDSNGTELGIAWPAFPILSDEQRCQVVLRHVVVVRDDGSPESVKSMRLRFPCN